MAPEVTESLEFFDCSHCVSGTRVYKGIRLKRWTNKFASKYLESLYLRYSHQRRRGALIFIILMNTACQVPLLWHRVDNYKDTHEVVAGIDIIFSSLGLVFNLVLLVICWRYILRSDHLHWASIACWLVLMVHSVLDGLQLTRNELLWYSVGYCINSVFAPYTMYPLSLMGSVVLSYFSIIVHMTVICYDVFVDSPELYDVDLWSRVKLIVADAVFYVTVHFAGSYIKFLTDKNQRKSFVETLRFLENRDKKQKANRKQEELIYSILPDFVAKEMVQDIENEDYQSTEMLQQFHKIYIHKYSNVSILFADVQGFTAMASRCTAQELVRNLNEFFARFDQLAVKNNCLRIKLLGDCYYGVCGLPIPRLDHADCAVRMGLDMIKCIQETKRKTGIDLDMRIGIHSGSVLCGVLGLRKWQFDIWSHDVQIANRMETAGVAGRVHISDTTYRSLTKEFQVDRGYGSDRDPFFHKNGIETYLVKAEVVPQNLNTEQPSDLLKTPPPKKQSITLEWMPEIPFKNRSISENVDDEILICMSKPKGKYAVSRTESFLTPVSPPSVENITSELENNLRSQGKFLNKLTLEFVDDKMEKLHYFVKNHMYWSNMICCYIIWLHIVVIQLIIHRNEGVFVILAATSTVLFLLLLVVLAENFQCFPDCIRRVSKCLSRNKRRRTVVISGTVILMAAASTLSFFASVKSGNHPEYSVFSWVICLVTVATALRINYVIKFYVTAFMLAVFVSIANLECYVAYFLSQFDERAFIVKVEISLILVYILILIIYHARLVEASERLFFLWEHKAGAELKTIHATRHTNMQLLGNVLPVHVAKHFLSREYRNEDLYSQYRENIGVLFASIPNFNCFYSEERGIECLRLLNEIIAAFDDILVGFTCIEKIKTVSATATYMAVSGLTPKGDDVFYHLGALVDFAITMRLALEDINKDSFNQFVLRVGISYGNLVCGVIGAKKPIFDVWGDTVNEASRMDSTGVPDMIQVPKHVAMILARQGYEVQIRGLVKVKGKGVMETYFVGGKSLKKDRCCQRSSSYQSSLGAMMRAIAQNRKKSTNQKENNKY